MRSLTSILAAVAFLASGVVIAEEEKQENKPIELTAAQMDTITAGSLGLPNGRVVQDNFDNPAPNVDGYLAAFLGVCDIETGAFCHPALTRRSDAAFVTAGKNPSVTPYGNDGPWTATVVSPVIDFIE